MNQKLTMQQNRLHSCALIIIRCNIICIISLMEFFYLIKSHNDLISSRINYMSKTILLFKSRDGSLFHRQNLICSNIRELSRAFSLSRERGFGVSRN